MFEGMSAEFFDPKTLVIFLALAVLSFVAVTVSFYKFVQFSRLGVGKRRRAEEILDNWLSGRAEEAMMIAAERKSVLARILQAVFSGVQAKPGESAYAEELGRQTAII